MPLFPRCRAVPKKFTQGQPYNATANQTHDFTVPDGKLWEIVSVSMSASDAATRSATALNRKNKVIAKLLAASSGTGQVTGPEAITDRVAKPILLFETDKVRTLFGAAQTSLTSYVILIVIEYDLGEVLEKQ